MVILNATALLLTVAPCTVQNDAVQHHVFTLVGGEVGDAFGTAALAVGDLNGDGIEEFAVGAPRPLMDGGGRVLIFDGATGVQLIQLQGPEGQSGGSPRFGASLALVPDLDGDGRGELAVGIPRDDVGGMHAGAVQIHTLPSGDLLHRIEGLPGEQLGSAMALFDADADGLPDLVTGGPGTGRTTVWSMAWIAAEVSNQVHGGPEWFWSIEMGARCGTAIAVLGDITGDGVPDLALGAPAAHAADLAHTGAVELVSGFDGTSVARLEGDSEGDAFGSSVAALASLDGDVSAELAVGIPSANEGRGAVRIWRGAWLSSGTGSELFADWSGTTPGDRLGARLAPIADVSGDGLEDLIVVATRFGATSGGGHVTVRASADGAEVFRADSSSGGPLGGSRIAVVPLVPGGAPEFVWGEPLDSDGYVGLARVLSVAPLRLASDRHRIPISTGADVTLSLDVGSELAGHFYVVLGSSSGTSPGVSSAVGTLPLNFDSYTTLSLSNPIELTGFSGFLDGAGRASAWISMDAALATTYLDDQLHYAAVTFDLAHPAVPVTSVTNAVPLGFDDDECATSDPALDCNGNGIDDACELLDGTAVDCDGNGVPDECQLDDPGADLDHDGVLDSCRQIVYVDADASGSGDGSSWSQAWTELSDALVNAPAFAEIWVAEGVYRPYHPLDPESATFSLDAGVAVYGGFSGVETFREERDWNAYPTVLSGDIANDDHAVGGSTLENAWSVVTVPVQDGPPARLEGFVIESGSSDYITGCVAFFATDADSCRGGGLYALGNARLSDCVFRENYGGGWGGAAFVVGDVAFLRCRFEGNGAFRGGAVSVYPGAQPRFVSCEVIANTAFVGGGLHVVTEDVLAIANSAVVGNQALGNGGAVYLEEGGLLLTGSTVVGNTAVTVGGALHGEENSHVTAVNSILWDNHASAGTLFEQQVALASTLEYSCVEGADLTLIGVGCTFHPPAFVSFPGPDGIAGSSDDDLRLAAESPCVDAGRTDAVPLDTLDADADGVVLETLPMDLGGGARVVDDPSIVDSGLAGPTGSVVDMGAHERQ